MSAPGESYGQPVAGAVGVPMDTEGGWGAAEEDFTLPTLIASQEREAERERLTDTDLHCPLGRLHNEGEQQS